MGVGALRKAGITAVPVVIVAALLQAGQAKTLAIRDVARLVLRGGTDPHAAGDINGDGKADVVIGDPAASRNDRHLSGSAYVLFGPLGRGSISLDTAVRRGFRIDGAGEEHFIGVEASGGGDINGDGLSDIVFGAALADPGVGRDEIDHRTRASAGRVYVVFGKRDRSNVDLQEFDRNIQGSQGFHIDGAFNRDLAGEEVAAVADMNGDGRDEVLVGAPFAGAAYVVFGKADPAPVDLLAFETGAQGALGYRIDHPIPPYDEDMSVDGLGDVNGDGRGDLGLGICPEFARCRTWVIFGKEDGESQNATELGRGGYRINGTEIVESLGKFSVRGPDFNRDGLADFGLVGERDAFVIFGKKTSETIATARLGRHGYRMRGGWGDVRGLGGPLDSLGGMGDVNRDGISDIIVGASEEGGTSPYRRPGAALVVFGKRDRRNVDLRRLGAAGYKLVGARRDSGVGETMAGPGDVTGDRRPDLLAGTLRALSYLVSGATFR